jgi:hypothetical protein
MVRAAVPPVEQLKPEVMAWRGALFSSSLFSSSHWQRCLLAASWRRLRRRVARTGLQTASRTSPRPVGGAALRAVEVHVGDSPLDRKTGHPLWAEPDFDDSKWETVDLTPKDGAFDPGVGLSGYVPGWTAKGHPGYWG